MRYAGAGYYFSHRRNNNIKQKKEGEEVEEEMSVEGVIAAMESWNEDLVWFIFGELRGRNLGGGGRPSKEKGTWDAGLDSGREVLGCFAGGRVRFAEMAF